MPLSRASVLISDHSEVVIHFGDALWKLGQFGGARVRLANELADVTMPTPADLPYESADLMS